MVILLKCKEFVIGYIQSKEKPSIVYNLTEAEWSVVKDIVATLEIPFRATKMLQTSNFTLSDFYAEWLLMKSAVRKRANTSSIEINNLARQLLFSLIKYSAQLLANPMLAAAVFMDPRFTRTMEKTPRKLAITKLLKIWDRLNRQKQTDIQLPAAENRDEISRLDELEELLAEAEVSERDPIDASPISIESDNEKMLNILEKFSDLPREKPNTSVIEFWDTNKLDKPELFQLSEIVFLNSPTQTYTERTFSAFNHIYSQRRSKLKHELLEDILLIYLNKDLFYKVAVQHLQEMKKE